MKDEFGCYFHYSVVKDLGRKRILCSQWIPFYVHTAGYREHSMFSVEEMPWAEWNDSIQWDLDICRPLVKFLMCTSWFWNPSRPMEIKITIKFEHVYWGAVFSQTQIFCRKTVSHNGNKRQSKQNQLQLASNRTYQISNNCSSMHQTFQYVRLSRNTFDTFNI